MFRSCTYVQSSLVLYIILLLGDSGKLSLFNSNNLFVGAANWAQVVGKQRQNVVTPARAGFSPRWGHVAIHTDTSIGVDVVESMIVMGGDTLESGTQNQDAVSEKVGADFLLLFLCVVYFCV
jgi:hypothetical protein